MSQSCSPSATPVTEHDPEKAVSCNKDVESGLPRRDTDCSILGRVKRAATGLVHRGGDKAPLTPFAIDYHARGYPKLAAFMNSDENFLMCRRYGHLHTRVMLYRQDELRELERDLYELDQEDAAEDPPLNLMSRERDDARDPAERRELIDKIDSKLKEYDDIVLRSRNMASLPTATHRDYSSLQYFMQDKAPLCPTEAAFIDSQQDFVALVDPKEGSWFDAFIEDVFLPIVPRPLARLMFSDPVQRASTQDERVSLYSKPRIDTFARILITIIAVALLMAPVVVLFSNEESGAVKIVVILAFTLVFSAALSVFTKAKRHEVFAATAAYCAVLVVFLGNFN